MVWLSQIMSGHNPSIENETPHGQELDKTVHILFDDFLYLVI